MTPDDLVDVLASIIQLKWVARFHQMEARHYAEHARKVRFDLIDGLWGKRPKDRCAESAQLAHMHATFARETVDALSLARKTYGEHRPPL